MARHLQQVRRRGDHGKRWLAFLRNHREAIVALDLFTVRTATFRLLYRFFLLSVAAMAGITDEVHRATALAE